MLRLVVGIMIVGLCSLPSAGHAGEINTVKGQVVEAPSTALSESDHDKMQELDRQIEEALKEQDLAPVVPPVALPQNNQEDKPDGDQDN